MQKNIGNIYIKRFYYFNVYVIKGKNGDILIDTGFIGIRKQLKKWLDNFNIKLVILTHAHVDHVWNVDYIKKLYNCDVAIGEFDIDNLDNSKISPVPSSEKYNRWCHLMKWGMNKFVPQKFDIDFLLKDNQVLDEYGIKIVYLPGHTNVSIGILYQNYLFAGDALVNRKRNPEIAYQNQNNEDAKNTYQKILRISPEIIFIGHDKAITIDKLQENKYQKQTN